MVDLSEMGQQLCLEGAVVADEYVQFGEQPPIGKRRER